MAKRKNTFDKISYDNSIKYCFMVTHISLYTLYFTYFIINFAVRKFSLYVEINLIKFINVFL